MAETTTAPVTGAAPTSADSAPAAAPAAPAKASPADRMAAAVKALEGTPLPAETPAAEPEKPPLPSTPEAPATEAVLRAEETASAQIRERNALADARRAFEAERTKWTQEQQAKLTRAEQLERLVANIERDPAAFIKAKEGGRSADQIARDIYLETVDIATLPPEQQATVQAYRDKRAIERRQSELEAQLQQERQQRASAEVHQRLASYRSELAGGLNALGDSTPLVRELVGKRPEIALGLMMDVAARLALENPQLGKQSTAQLAERVEQAIAEELEPFHGYFERKYKPAQPPAQASKPAAEAGGITPTLTDATPVRSKAKTEAERLARAAAALGGQRH